MRGVVKLTRITKIRDHRVFLDFAWPSDLHSFGQFNVVYGWNACGKTTLSALLALVEKRTPLTEGELELEIDDTTKVTGTELSTSLVPEVRVFNRDFINSTLQSAGDIAPIYFLGADSVDKQAQVDKLKNDLALANGEITAATTEKKAADAKLDDFCISRAKFIKELLTTANSAGYNNYDKRRFKEAVEPLPPETAARALLSDDHKVRLRSQKDAQPKAAIEKVEVPAVDLPRLEAEVRQLSSRSVVAQTLDELTGDTELAAWVQRGLALHSGDRASETCRFCLQPLDATRRSALEAHFNDAFARLQLELGELLSKLTTAKRTVGSIRLPETSGFYEHLVDQARAAISSVRAAAAAQEASIDGLIARAEAKRDNPFAPEAQAASDTLSADVEAKRDNPSVVEAQAASAQRAPIALTGAVAALNDIVAKHNETSEDFKRSVDEACKTLERSYVAEAQPEYLLLAGAATKAESALVAVKSKPATIQGEIDSLEIQILEHRRPADELTEELRAYLGRDELRFEIKLNGYALTRGGQPVSHLSEGERTAITFLYFLKSLQDRKFDMKNGIVIVDDPVSSLDANALFSAFGYMKERTKKCGQLFILTHNFSFFRLVRNWFHKLPGQKRKVEDRPARFFLLRSCRRSDGLRTAELGPLDPLLEEHESEYQYLFKRVYDEARRTDVASLEHHYGMPNVARRLVESFLAFRFPAETGDGRLHRAFERVAFEEARKTRILRLLNTYSHSSAVSEPEHDLSLLAETQPVLLDLLEMMKAIDKEHYEELEKLMAPAEAAS